MPNSELKLPEHLHHEACQATRFETDEVEKPPKDGLMRRADDSLMGADIFEKVRVPGDKLRRVRCLDCGAAAYFPMHGEEPLHVVGR
jgi:hypothetical protein